jgi:multimeric flavodoxin WrbA
MEGIINKIQALDVIVIATPMYFLTMNGRLKTMIDHLGNNVKGMIWGECLEKRRSHRHNYDERNI